MLVCRPCGPCKGQGAECCGNSKLKVGVNKPNFAQGFPKTAYFRNSMVVWHGRAADNRNASCMSVQLWRNGSMKRSICISHTSAMAAQLVS